MAPTPIATTAPVQAPRAAPTATTPLAPTAPAARRPPPQQAEPGSGAAPAALPPPGAHRLTLTKVTQDVYRDSGSRLIYVTSLCYEYVYGDSATLISDRNPDLSRVIFSSGTECYVDGAYRTNASMESLGNDVYLEQSSGRVYRTAGCSAYAYGEDAVILEDQIIFVDSREVCDRY